MDVRNRKQNTQSFCYKLEPKGSANGFYEFISHWNLCSNAKEWLPNDKLTLLFEIEALVASVHTTGRGLMSQMNTQVNSKVLDNYGDLFECRKLSDVVLVAVGHSTKTEHRAHRAILAARSPVFGAMFDPNAKEHSESHVIIRHISGNVIEEMLRFVYTGKVQKLDELADGLLIAADKYELGLLKDICEKYIVNNLNIENALSMLVFADKHSVLLLRSKAIEYIKVNLSTLIETDNWQTVKDKPELYFELLSQAVTENQSKIDEFSRSSQLMKSQNSSYFYWIIFLSIIIVFMGINAFKN